MHHAALEDAVAGGAGGIFHREDDGGAAAFGVFRQRWFFFFFFFFRFRGGFWGWFGAVGFVELLEQAEFALEGAFGGGFVAQGEIVLFDLIGGPVEG